MPTQNYLYVHIPERGLVTLSLPGGLERAFRDGQLPESSLIWHTAGRVWLPVTLHPEIARLQLTTQEDFDYEFLPEEPEPEPLPSPPPPAPCEQLNALVEACFAESPQPIEPHSLIPVPDIPEPETPAEDPNQLPLIAVDDWQRHLEEFSKFVARSTAREQRKQAARNSGAVRKSGALPVIVAGVPAEVLDPYEVSPPELARFRTRLLAGAFVLLIAMGIGGWFWYRSPNRAAPTQVAVGLSPRQLDSLARATAASNVQVSAPNPLLDLEAALENDLRIAEAVIWQPAIDFGSEEQVLRSSRKLNAVRNSVGLYRLGAWRLFDSLDQPGDPRIEPFDEAERVDAVIGIMQAAVVLLDSLSGQYRVSSEMLVFDNPMDADHYNQVARIADSLLRAPVASDSFPNVRAPRRIITRLLATLPTAVGVPPLPAEEPASGNP